MTKLSQLVDEKSLIPDLKSVDKASAIREVLSYCDLSAEDFSEEEIFQLFMEREEEQSTGIGEGLAFPHARLTGLTKMHVAIGCSGTGINFKALDKKPVYFIILMIVNRTRPNELLKTRAAIAKLLSREEDRSNMLQAASNSELMNIIKKADITVDYDITAKDIMRPYIAYIGPDLTIRDAARALHTYHVDSLPVIDDQQVFHGEISCYDIFSYGLPDFFNNLHVISFVKHMNPFEQYFKEDRTLKVATILKNKARSDLVITTQATLMEIIFEMTVKNKESLYVLSDEGKLKGILDRYSIIDKIIIAR